MLTVSNSTAHRTPVHCHPALGIVPNCHSKTAKKAKTRVQRIMETQFRHISLAHLRQYALPKFHLKQNVQTHGQIMHISFMFLELGFKTAIPQSSQVTGFLHASQGCSVNQRSVNRLQPPSGYEGGGAVNQSGFHHNPIFPVLWPSFGFMGTARGGGQNCPHVIQTIHDR